MSDDKDYKSFMAKMGALSAHWKDTTKPTAKFDSWVRSFDGPGLILGNLSMENELVEIVCLDVTELPDRPDLLERLSPVGRTALLSDAAKYRALASSPKGA